jgi:hypothetical protein
MADEIEIDLDDIVEPLNEIAKELRNIAIVLQQMRAATVAEIKLREAQLAAMNQPRQPQRYVSGRWPLRDGDTYGIVAAQPEEHTSPEPPVHADRPPGHLRSSDEC